MNNEIYLFSFYQGTTIRQFAAHEDYITNVLCKQVRQGERSQQMLVTTSADQTIKLWEISFGGAAKQPPPKIIYDHEEEITSAFCSV